MLPDNQTQTPKPLAARNNVQRSPMDRPELPKHPSHTIWFVVIALIIIGGLAYWGVERRKAGAMAQAAKMGGHQPAVPVLAGVVEETNVPVYLDGLGTVQAYNTVTVRVRVDGELKKVAFTEGQDVKAGDVLAQIDPAPYQTALDQAKAKKGEDEAQLANAQINLKRETDLLAAKIDSQQVYDTQKAQADQLAATVKADEAAIESAQVNLDYTTIRSPLTGRSGIRLVDQGNIVHAADSNGLVVITQLQPISVLFTLPEQELDSIHQEMAKISEPMKVFAVGRDNNDILDEGTLAVVDNQIDTATGTIRLKGNFPNAQRRLWPGEFVNARLLLTVRTNGLVVPTQAIQRGPNGAYVFVIEQGPGKQRGTNAPGAAAGGKGKHAETSAPSQTASAQGGHPGAGTNQPQLHVRIQNVTVAPEVTGTESLITAGLKKGDRIVVDGQYKLQDGSSVRIVSPDKAGSVDTRSTESAQ